ncbi:hypothetical protein OAK81_01370 [Verrucomicrobiales bacterium]|nr:hypothetical protein [Verrucomicrobiales bacterium]MDC0291922.1 hypothetical protein [Verrucomicrobiales bacterium]MDC0322012.1 hypothetical protein [Verrucomicrobiales bacterium]
MKNFLKTSILATASVLVLCNCQESGPIEVTEVREINPAVKLEIPVLAKSDTERFRMSEKKPQAQRPATPGAPRLIWDLPEGWKEVETTQMRDANLRFGENDEGECYLTKLSGGGGGLVANVNRWRGQMGLPDAKPEEINALPKKPLFGTDATYIDLEGDFGGMGGGEAKKDYKMLGLVLTAQGGAVFVKMTGPKTLVDANTAKFDAFCQSLNVDFGAAPEAPAAPAAPSAPESKANKSE